ncbi:type IV pilus assembly protein PilW [Ectothiorhodospira magna]|uniref:Type IV pilus assembly protein PilW n=1 Tax=Ectothiorhodospira magna TaxID=867345 RepID=A0A1H9B7T9_9GAMM|nr:PilW family protein [Ectothiorhodospira magna]SEP85082.1 type IV pilus assembly protein PilW [Ectothiorhodospira magna]
MVHPACPNILSQTPHVRRSGFPRRGAGQSGLSLVELMVAMVIGLILVGGAIQIFLGTSQTYRLTESLSRMQEDGRFALDQLNHDLRHVGFRGGCQGEIQNLLDEDDSKYDASFFDLDDAIEGWNGVKGKAPDDYVAGTDVFVIKHAANITGLAASGNTGQNSANINLQNKNSGVPQGTIVVVGDAESCDMFQNTANENAGNLNRGAGGAGISPGNKKGNQEFSKAYSGDLNIFTITSHLYYIGTQNGQRALRRVSYDRGFTVTPPNDEIILGVWDMQITYLLRNGTEYVDADAVGNNWRDVIAVRVSLLLHSEHNNLADAPMVLPYNGAAFTAPDRRLYQVFTTTVALRNRLP